MADNDRSLGCLLRLFWMGVGNGLLVLLALRILDSHGRLSVLDAAYWVVVITMVGTRYIDIRHFGGTDGYGEPCTLANWQQYAIRLVIFSGLVWIAVRILSAFR